MNLRYSYLLLAFLFIFCADLKAQVYLPDFKKKSPSDFLIVKPGSLKISEVKITGTDFGGLKTYKMSDWAAIEVQFSLHDREPDKETLFSSVKITFAFDAPTLDEKGKVSPEGFTLFKNSYTYLHLPESERNSYYTARMYVHPLIVERFGGKSKFIRPENLYAKIEASVEGLSSPSLSKALTVAVVDNDKGGDTWFNTGSPMPKGALMSPIESPFWSFEGIDYPMIERK